MAPVVLKSILMNRNSVVDYHFIANYLSGLVLPRRRWYWPWTCWWPSHCRGFQSSFSLQKNLTLFIRFFFKLLTAGVSSLLDFQNFIPLNQM